MELHYYTASLFSLLIALIAAEKCTTPNNEEGECVSIYSCQRLIDALATKRNESIEFVRKSKCGNTEADRKVCCGSASEFSNRNAVNRPLLPDTSYCGYQHADDYFRNDTGVGINEFPWLATLQYNTSGDSSEELQDMCAGSLINDRYVLTAAHCIYPREFVLVRVRLGEYSIQNKTDCLQESSFYECSEPPQEFAIEKKIPHPEFNNREKRNDIGLLRLDKRVTYSDYIRPICLPLPGTKLAQSEDTVVTSGWGRTEFAGMPSDTKKKILTKLITNEECARLDRNIRRHLNENHFCTKQLDSNNEFSCQGDSGGPVIFSHRNQWHQEGILSFGSGCGLQFPDVYTKVSNYLDWIKNNIEP